jgi:DNA-binding transcriptional ArsR family regulator
MVIVLSMPAAADTLFKALADPTRRALFERLARGGEQTVHALTEAAGISQPAVSKHLVILKRARLVRHRREGRETHYRAQPRALTPLIDWMALYGAFWNERLDRLESLLNESVLDESPLNHSPLHQSPLNKSLQNKSQKRNAS